MQGEENIFQIFDSTASSTKDNLDFNLLVIFTAMVLGLLARKHRDIFRLTMDSL